MSKQGHDRRSAELQERAKERKMEVQGHRDDGNGTWIEFAALLVVLNKIE